VRTSPTASDLYDAAHPLYPDMDAAPAEGVPMALALVTGPHDAGSASTSTRFALVTQSGCLWLRPTD